QGTECIYGCYVHSAILPTFHRRCYWLLQNPDIVLVHYLNVPYPDDNKMAVITPNLALWGDKKEWTKEELVSQLKPMFFSEDEPDTANEIEISTAETVEAIVSQLMEKQRMARQTALVKQLECGCPDANCADGKSCSHPMRRISAAKSVQELGKRTDGHGAGTAPNVLIGSRSLTGQNSIRPGNQNPSGLVSLSGSNTSSQLTSVSSHITNGIGSQGNHLGGHRSAMIITSNQHQQQQQQQQQHHQQQQQQHPHHHPQQQLPSVHSHTHHGHPHAQQQHTLTMNGNSNSSSSSSNSTNSNNTTNTSDSNVGSNQLTAIGHSNSQVTSSNGNGTGTDRSNTVNGVPGGARDARDINLNGSNENHISMIGTTGQTNRPSNGLGTNQRSAADGNCGDSSGSGGIPNGNSQNGQGTVHHNRISINGNGASVATSTPPLVLSLGQNLGAPGSLLILNGQQQSYVCQSQHQKPNDKDTDGSIKTESSSSSIAKQEMMDASSSPVPSLTHHQTRQSSQAASSSPSSTTTGGTSEKQSFESIFGYQEHTPMASPVQSMENSGPTHHHHDNLPFFNETLDLSQEDIQKTLSANMPLGGHVPGHDTTPTDDAMNGEINPMDFIENCGDNHGTVDDDVFVNLDAFDMLVEFPELELDAKNEFLRDGTDDGTDDTTTGGGDLAGDSGSELGQYKHHVQSEQQQQPSQPIANASTITDFSPEWAYPEGGIKVLVTGPWSASSAYTVLF
uniref:CG-1 domain-containing protein n=1 Tax=Anopheles maculatus TaxID=74869 RepID=A0A182SME4_9DIPT